MEKVKKQVKKQTKKQVDVVNNTESKKKDKNMVSCLMLTYDRRLTNGIKPINLFENSVKQFANQTYKNRELIVVCSGSKQYYDSCVSKIEELKGQFENLDCEIFFVSRSEYPTIADLRNKSVKEAKGDFIMTWDDDDNRSVTIIEDGMKAMTENNADIVTIKYVKVRLLLGRPSTPCNYFKGFEPSMIAKKTDKVLYHGTNSDTTYIEELKSQEGYKEFVREDNDFDDYEYCYWTTNITEREKFLKIINTSKKFSK